YHVTPGTYTRINVSSGDKVRFDTGVFHITGNQGVTFAGGSVVESTGRSASSPVSFVMDDGAVFSSAGGATVTLYSGPLYNNILIYSYSDGTAIDITGGPGTSFYGTLYAPNGTVKITGGPTPTVTGQVFAYDIKLGGNVGDTAVKYDPNFAANIPGPLLVE
ncbi:MAG: hypothetical protein HYX89_02955, partial [Chloroflexi bacterium]|nr:hypothetical protein [Chloroflexota bacterium]